VSSIPSVKLNSKVLFFFYLRFPQIWGNGGMDPRFINSVVFTAVTRIRIKIIIKLNLLTCIREMPDSTLAYIIDYHD
jgi:hypothetical protein